MSALLDNTFRAAFAQQAIREAIRLLSEGKHDEALSMLCAANKVTSASAHADVTRRFEKAVQA